MDHIKTRMKYYGYESNSCCASYSKVPRDLKKYMMSHFSKKDAGVALFLLSGAVAYRSGYSKYANFKNFVPEGSWAGGKIGLRSILCNKKLQFEDVVGILDDLQNKGFLTYTVNKKFIKYQMNDFDIQNSNISYDIKSKKIIESKNTKSNICIGVNLTRSDDTYVQNGYAKNYNEKYLLNGKREYEYKNIVWDKPECHKDSTISRPIYARGNYGYIKFPVILFDERAQKLKEHKGKKCLCARTKAEASPFSEGEAFLDLYVHTVRRDGSNIFSWFCPTVMINYDATSSYSELADRWGWSKSKVQRFFNKHNGFFRCVKLNKNCGSIIFNIGCSKKKDKLPSRKKVQKIIREITPRGNRRKEDVNEFIRLKSKKYIQKYFYNTKYCPDGNANILYREEYFKKEEERESTFFKNTVSQFYDSRGFLVDEIQRALIYDNWLSENGYTEIACA